jgi:8-oxo-dGTP pyrophosphatase MutT (NUDIX family)
MTSAEHTFITGHSGSGKTTLAKQLGESKNMPVASLDDIMDSLVEANPDKYGKFYNFPESLRRDSLIEALKVKRPTIFEGTQVLVDPSLTEGHTRLLIDIPDSRIVAQRVARQMKKKKYEGVPKKFHINQAKELLDLYGTEIKNFKNQPGVTIVSPDYVKTANYRDRASLILHDGKGNVFAAPNVDGPKYEPFFVPGGGIYEEEGIHPEPDEDTIRAGLEREAMEEVGVRLKDIQDFGFKPTIVNKDKAWQERQQARRGIPYKGIREYLRAAVSAGEDKSIHGSAGDDFLQYKPKYMNAIELANALEEHNVANKHNLHPDEYSVRDARIRFIRELANQKTAEYRDRATLVLHDGKGNVFAAPELDDPLKMPYHFPGGGIYDEEDINNPLPTSQQVEAGLRREALEELGYNLKNIQDFGYGPKNIDMGPAWRARAVAKRGQPFKGIREHLRAAEIESEDNSLLNSEGDSFHKYYPEYVEANLLAKQIEDHAMANKNRISSSELANRAGIAKFIRNLAVEKTAEEKRYRPKVQGLLYTPDLRVLAAKSQGAGSGLRQFNNYKFPGGGIEPGESLVEAAKKELLEETGYGTAGDPFEFGMPAITVDWDDAFRQQALKKGRDFHGEISHFLAAPVGARDLSLHGKEGDQLLDADFVPVDDLIADLEHTSSLPDNEYAMFDKNKLEAARRFKEHMTKKAYYIGRRLAILAHS